MRPPLPAEPDRWPVEWRDLYLEELRRLRDDEGLPEEIAREEAAVQVRSKHFVRSVQEVAEENLERRRLEEEAEPPRSFTDATHQD